ncbi:hypothetical protein [Hymenobacter sp. B81]|uniref:hypothetical protein n=1 Tax=Hymenobacter sp. B81 TaxID=3344878 RepID=UPI0037DBF37B
MSAPAPEPTYTIPASYRRMENLHIVFWLLKDVSWCMVWKPLGMAMVVPTLCIALVIAWRTRHLASELAHNLAIVLWITANSYWMTSEFFGFDTVQFGHGITGKHLSLLPFVAGLVVLAYYYLVQKPRETAAGQVATL